MGDTSVTAIVLFDIGKTHFELDKNGIPYLVFKRHKRVKILKKRAYNYANVGIHYHTKYETLDNLQAAIYTYAADTVVSQRLDSSDFFEDEVDKYIKIKKFTFPQVCEGAIIEYSYEQKLKNLIVLKDWEFQSEIPTLWSEYQITIPERYDYKIIYQGINSFYRRTKEKCILGNRVASHANCYNWAMKNIAGFQAEDFMTTSRDFIAKIDFHINGVYTNGILKPILNTWDKIAEELTDEEYFVEKITDYEFLGFIVQKITKKAHTPQEKLQIIFDYVKTNLKWNEHNSLLAQTNLKKAFDRKTGNSAEINFILLKMLLAANIHAYPIVLSTRENGKLNYLTPLIDKLNYVIVLAKVQGTKYYLDATNTQHTIGMLPFKCLNRKGLMVAGRKGVLVDIESIQSYERDVTMELTLHESGNIQGKAQVVDKDYSAFQTRKNIETLGMESYLKNNWFSPNSHLSLTSAKVDNLADEKLPLQINFQLEGENIINQNRVYIEPFLFKSFEVNPLKKINRKFPIDLGYPIIQNYALRLTIPAGFEIEDLPKNQVYTSSDQNLEYAYQITQESNIILLKSHFLIKKINFLPDEFNGLQNLFNMMLNKQAEQIVLKKTL